MSRSTPSKRFPRTRPSRAPPTAGRPDQHGVSAVSGPYRRARTYSFRARREGREGFSTAVRGGRAHSRTRGQHAVRAATRTCTPRTADDHRPHRAPTARGSDDRLRRPGPAPYDAPVLELRGPLDPARLRAALDHLAVHDPGAPAWRHRVDGLGPGHHALRLAVDDTGTPHDAFPYGRLADLLTHPLPGARPTRSLTATPLQRELLADAETHPGRHVEQLTAVWHGPSTSNACAPPGSPSPTTRACCAPRSTTGPNL